MIHDYEPKMPTFHCLPLEIHELILDAIIRYPAHSFGVQSHVQSYSIYRKICRKSSCVRIPHHLQWQAAEQLAYLNEFGPLTHLLEAPNLQNQGEKSSELVKTLLKNIKDEDFGIKFL
jgi:hypothetical protein